MTSKKSAAAKTVEAMIVPVGRMPRKVRLRADGEGSFLRAMQECVGGLIEPFPALFDDEPAVYVNEEGKLPWTGCMPNRAVYDDGGDLAEIVFGDMLCVGLDPETGGVRNITAEERAKVRARFGTRRSIGSAAMEIAKMIEANRRESAG